MLIWEPDGLGLFGRPTRQEGLIHGRPIHAAKAFKGINCWIGGSVGPSLCKHLKAVLCDSKNQVRSLAFAFLFFYNIPLAFVGKPV